MSAWIAANRRYDQIYDVIGQLRDEGLLIAAALVTNESRDHLSEKEEEGDRAAEAFVSGLTSYAEWRIREHQEYDT